MSATPSMFYLVYTITLLYFACPDVLSAVGETSYGMRVGFVGLDEVLTIILFIYLFIYLFVSEVQSLLLSV